MSEVPWEAETWPIIEHEPEHEPVIPPDLRSAHMPRSWSVSMPKQTGFGRVYTAREVVAGETPFILTPEERLAVEWQMREHLCLGSFTDALYETLRLADEEQLRRLALAYPAHVRMIRLWRTDREFARRLRSLPFDFSI